MVNLTPFAFAPSPPLRTGEGPGGEVGLHPLPHSHQKRGPAAPFAGTASCVSQTRADRRSAPIGTYTVGDTAFVSVYPVSASPLTT
jgi:hypothetical protein